MFLLLLLLTIPALLFYNYYYKRRHLPPGPSPLPFLGNVLTFGTVERLETKFIEWSQQYGPTFTYWLGEIPFVAVCDHKDMIRYFVKNSELFSDRMDFKAILDLARGGQYGVVLTNGESWKEQRRFALKVLRDFGTKNQMEERITHQLHLLFNNVNKNLSKEEIDFFPYTDLAVGSIINGLLCGYSFTEELEHEFDRLKFISVEGSKAFTNPLTNFIFNYPSLLKVPYINQGALFALDLTAEMMAHFDRQIEKHSKENDYNEDLQPVDYIDAFLLERAKQIRLNGEEGEYSLDQLRNVCFDLWNAGQETTSANITWLIAYLIRHPEVQEKLQEELDSVIGSKRIIGYAERQNLPYTCAVINEVQRCSNILSQNLPRAVTKDVHFDGYIFKKGTVVIPQISVLLQDSKVFPSPERFNPDRFIDENGKLKQVEELIPFSIGKRICLGEGMARMELFIFTANLFNHFKFSAGKVAPTMKKLSVASTMIEPYQCKVERR